MRNRNKSVLLFDVDW